MYTIVHIVQNIYSLFVQKFKNRLKLKKDINYHLKDKMSKIEKYEQIRCTIKWTHKIDIKPKNVI